MVNVIIDILQPYTPLITSTAKSQEVM